MPFVVEPQLEEELHLQKEFRGSHDPRLCDGGTNQAVYIPVQKLVLKRDPWSFKRVLLSDVLEVSLIKQRPISLILLSAAMIIFGTVLSVLMMWRAFNPMEGVPYNVSGWPMAIAVGGIFIPFVARKRKTILIRMRKGKFKWKSQLAVDKKTRQLCSDIQAEILEACKKAGIKTTEVR